MTGRRPLIAGNWKMNHTHREVAPYLDVLLRELPSGARSAAEVVLLPPFTAIPALASVLDHTAPGVALTYGAQDLAPAANGAFTGDIAGSMLWSLGCTYVLVGHSERRRHHGDDDMVHAKVQAAFRHGLIPIICVGEALDIRRQGTHVEYTLAQVRDAFADVPEHEAGAAVIAYEPVWAIGTGEVATPADAQEVCSAIRQQLRDLYSPELAQNTRILYGGSVTASTTPELMAQPDVDGALVGGASLNPESFAAICLAATSTRKTANV